MPGQDGHSGHTQRHQAEILHDIPPESTGISCRIGPKLVDILVQTLHQGIAHSVPVVRAPSQQCRQQQRAGPQGPAQRSDIPRPSRLAADHRARNSPMHTHDSACSGWFTSSRIPGNRGAYSTR